jgi:hypothetical protein
VFIGLYRMDLSGHHSNPSGPLKALLSGPSGVAETPLNDVAYGPIAPAGTTIRDVRARHPRQGRIIDAITRVLTDHGEHMQARAVHAAVQALLDEPVRWTSVKATLAGNLDGPAPRFVRVARGRYAIPLPSEPETIAGHERRQGPSGRHGTQQAARYLTGRR